MDPKVLLQLVDSISREKNIDPELVFVAIESALVSATRKHYGEEADVEFHIAREDGTATGHCEGEPLDIEETIGRIGAQTAKQVIIQKVREAERDALIEEFSEQIGHLVSGIVTRSEGGATTVDLHAVEAILPRSEQIPGETHHANERIRAVIFEVKPAGSRVKVVLSRTRPQLVERLFEQEIPEIADGVININRLAREPGYRSKVAVSSSDPRVDCVGACVGVRGNRIKNIVDELAGERIDIVRFNDDPQVLIPNALQPATVDEVILCQMLGRAIVLVQEDQLSLAIGRRGQNVRLASKLCVWDIEIMTQEELEEQIETAVAGYSTLEGVDEDLANRLVGEGYLSYDDLSVIEPSNLMEMGEISEEQADVITEQAEKRAEEAEVVAQAERRKKRELERLQKAAAAAEVAEQALQAEREAREALIGGSGDETAEAVEVADAEAAEVEAGQTETAEDAQTPPAETQETEPAVANREEEKEPAEAGEEAAAADAEHPGGDETAGDESPAESEEEPVAEASPDTDAEDDRPDSSLTSE